MGYTDSGRLLPLVAEALDWISCTYLRTVSVRWWPECIERLHRFRGDASTAPKFECRVWSQC
jgi:hypothetical protein